MQIDSDLVKQLRTERQWSQSQLGEACGLTLRTIQRLEKSGRGSIESVRSLAAVFEVNPNNLIVKVSDEPVMTPAKAIRLAFAKFADFSSVANRAEYWWFLLFVALVTAAATIMAEKLYQLTALILIVPFLAVGARRLNDTGHSVWWQLLFFVPFGFIPVLYMMAEEQNLETNASDIA